jgi:hypothetical protein
MLCALGIVRVGEVSRRSRSEWVSGGWEEVECSSSEEVVKLLDEDRVGADAHVLLDDKTAVVSLDDCAVVLVSCCFEVACYAQVEEVEVEVVKVVVHSSLSDFVPPLPTHSPCGSHYTGYDVGDH